MPQRTPLRRFEGVAVPQAGTYQIDPSHSVVEFVVRHRGLAKVRGRFNDFTGTTRCSCSPLFSAELPGRRVTPPRLTMDKR